jgi:hypothetical protein
MASPRNVAALVGPAIVALTSSEALNYHIWATNLPPVTYLNGTVLFVVGVAILRAHDRWVLGWPVIVTLAGWFAVLGGLLRMFVPEASQVPRTSLTYVGLGILLVVGCFLTYKAYATRGEEPASR